MQVRIDSALLDSLTEQAKGSERLRMSYDLRNSETDASQRMLNAVEPSSYSSSFEDFRNNGCSSW